MTVSPASAMAKTRIRVALDSNTQRLGGKAHGAEHARPVSVGVGNGTNSSGNGAKATSQCLGLLRRRNFSRLIPFAFPRSSRKGKQER